MGHIKNTSTKNRTSEANHVVPPRWICLQVLENFTLFPIFSVSWLHRRNGRSSVSGELLACACGDNVIRYFGEKIRSAKPVMCSTSSLIESARVESCTFK